MYEQLIAAITLLLVACTKINNTRNLKFIIILLCLYIYYIVIISSSSSSILVREISFYTFWVLSRNDILSPMVPILIAARSHMTGQENPAGFYALYIVCSSVHTTRIFVVNSLPVARAIVFSLLATFTIEFHKPKLLCE